MGHYKQNYAAGASPDAAFPSELSTPDSSGMASKEGDGRWGPSVAGASWGAEGAASTSIGTGPTCCATWGGAGAGAAGRAAAACALIACEMFSAHAPVTQ